MAYWLLACKEIDGSIYVCRLPRTANKTTPGVPSPWYYVGPGNSPLVQNYDSGNQFILIFDYLSHLAARVIDISIWPPTQVDPIQTTPVITIQQPEDVLLLKPASETNVGWIQEFPMPPQIQISPINITTEDMSSPPTSPITSPVTSPVTSPITVDYLYSITITTQSSYNPGVDLHWYRVYRQPLSGGNWTLVMDWQPTTLNYTDTEIGGLEFNYRATLGISYDRNNPNNPTQHFEGLPGNVVVADSNLHPFIYTPVVDESYSLSLQQTISFGSFGAKQLYYVETLTDVLDFKIAAKPSPSSLGVMPRLTSYKVFSVTTPVYTPPSDVESVGISLSGQLLNVSSDLLVSDRLDQ